MVEIGGALLFCEERLSQSNDWRVHALMLEQLSVLPFCLPGDYVYNNFVPALFHRLLHMVSFHFISDLKIYVYEKMHHNHNDLFVHRDNCHAGLPQLMQLCPSCDIADDLSNEMISRKG
jgi:hypothetical protein